MKLILDIECNKLEQPTKIWVCVCKDIDTGRIYIFRNLTENEEDIKTFGELTRSADRLIGHNILGYDLPILCTLVPSACESIQRILQEHRVIDTLIVSKLVDYSRPTGHSIEAYGEEFGLEKIKFNDWTKWSQEMEDYCVRDVEITLSVYNRYSRIITDPSWSKALKLEHSFQLVVNNLHSNGFSFNTSRAKGLLERVEKDLAELDSKILEAFPPKLKLIREIHPKVTKHGTLSKTDFRWVKDGDLTDYNGGPFCRCNWEDFNPSSHKQIIDVLSIAGWSPINKTKTHIETEREINRTKYIKKDNREVDLEDLNAKMVHLAKYGWKIDEDNLGTLPPSAPSPARLLAKRILLESRRRTLTEWLGLVHPDTGRIHGKFQGIGTWTHRMATQKPNVQNIPNEYELDGTKKLLGKELRALWQAPRNRLLVGVDAEGIQLRIFAHYIDDKEFTEALVKGKKDDKTDPHSLNQRIMGSVCKSRSAAKRFIYALLLGAGLGKLAEILECSKEEAQEALNRILIRYTGFAYLKKEVIPKDAERGYFIGLDGRKVILPGDTRGQRSHLCMSGYLQNGEAIIMKKATLKWEPILHEYQAMLVNMVHDEWQTETPNNMSIAVEVAKFKADSLRIVGEELGLKCPLAGSYWNDDYKDYTIGTNWSVTH